MRRAVREIVDPSPLSVEPLWDYFDDQCAYCGKPLVRGSRDGQVDHATSVGGNHLGNLVLACSTCNGDEKREQEWREFLHKKASGAEYTKREARIRGWFELHHRDPVEPSADMVRLQNGLNELVELFDDKCKELKELVKSAHVDDPG